MLLEDAIRLYGVTQNDGALELRLTDPGALVDGIVRLAQACVRVADLSYTRRQFLQSAFVEEIEEILSDTEVTYEPNVELVGRFAKPVWVDFLVTGTHLHSSVLTLSTAHPAQAHVQANEIFRRWFDLDVPERPEQRVTIFDDRHAVYRAEDLERLAGMSALIAFSDRQTIHDVLAA